MRAAGRQAGIHSQALLTHAVLNEMHAPPSLLSRAPQGPGTLNQQLCMDGIQRAVERMGAPSLGLSHTPSLSSLPFLISMHS